jgi:phosphate transport system protein
MASRNAYARELDELHELILKMGCFVEQAIAKSVKALAEQDINLAREVINGDLIIDRLELEIENKCLRLIALQQPMAIDLRRIATGLKIITDLERMADHAEDIAKTTIRMKDETLFTRLVNIPRMSEIAQEMVRDSLDAYVHKDEELARRMCERDDEMDGIYSRLFDELLDIMENNQGLVKQATYLLNVGQFLERIADHATNIGEWVIYMVTGDRMELND